MASPTAHPHTVMDYRKRVCQAMNHISRNLDRDLPLKEIADAAAFSMFHFHRIFKAVVGETVAEFTRRLRLEHAAGRLLADPARDITTVAMDCGFSSSQSFAKAFRKQFDASPSDYRKSKTGHMDRKTEHAMSLQAVYDSDTATLIQTQLRKEEHMDADVREMPEFHVAYVRKMGPYGKETAEAAFGELMQWAGPRGHLSTGQMLGVYWDNPDVTAPERCRNDACVSVPEGTATEGQVALQTIPGGPHAVCHFEVKTDSFQQAWEDAYTWLVGSGHECDEKPCYELYHVDPERHPEGKWVFDICIPLKRNG